MKLYIDTSNSEKIVVGLDEKKFETPAKKGASQRLLPFIVELLEKEGKKLEEIKEIIESAYLWHKNHPNGYEE